MIPVRGKSLVTGAGLLLGLLPFVPFRIVVITGRSMQPTLHNHQLVVMKTSHDDLARVRRGDVVVFRHGNETLVKRVCAVGGDTVTLAEFRNGLKAVLGDLGFPPDRVLRYAHQRPGQVRIARCAVPPGSIYVVGDNRNSSVDSRDFGAVPASSVIGRISTP